MISVINMEKPSRKQNRLPDYDYSQSGAYFVTICTQDRKKILSKISVGTPTCKKRVSLNYLLPKQPQAGTISSYKTFKEVP